MSPPAAQLTGGLQYPQYNRYPFVPDSNAGYPDNNEDVSGTTQQGQYAFYLNEIRTAIQNVTEAPDGDTEFACNPSNPLLDPLLQYLYEAQGTAGNFALPLSPPLITGPLPAGTIEQ